MPASLLIAERTALVAGLVAVTLAPTITAPVESFTVPVISPKVCALISPVSPQATATKATTLNIERTKRFILRSSWILVFLKNHIYGLFSSQNLRGKRERLERDSF